MDRWEGVGERLVNDAIQSRQSVYEAICSIESQQIHPTGRAVMMAAVSHCLGIVWLAKERGWSFEYKHPIFGMTQICAVLELNRYIAAGDADTSGAIVREAALIVDALVKKDCVEVISQPDTGSEEHKPADPVLVQVVGLPIRQITTEIIRDENGNIVSSIQIENDAVGV